MVGGLLSCAVAASVGVGLGRPSAARFSGAVVMALVALDLGWANIFTLEVRPADSELSTAACGLASRTDAFGEHRIFSPSYSLPQQAAERCHLELADGVSPLQLTAYREAMAAATGFSIEPYSVTLPPFPDGETRSDWGPTIDAGALGMLNVDRLVSAFPSRPPACRSWRTRMASGCMATRLPGRAPGSRRLVTKPRGDPWKSLEWTPNRIRLHAVGPGRLVLSEIVYPGWRAQVDGVRVPIGTTAGILRSVDLPAGEHQVILTFVPASVFVGLGLAIVAILALALLKVRR